MGLSLGLKPCTDLGALRWPGPKRCPCCLGFPVTSIGWATPIPQSWPLLVSVLHGELEEWGVAGWNLQVCAPTGHGPEFKEGVQGEVPPTLTYPNFRLFMHI